MAVMILPGAAVSTSAANLKAPVLNTPTNTETGVKLSWKKVDGAAKYRVFIKSGGKWTKLSDTTGLSYLHTKVKSGKQYSYTVRCISYNGKQYTSSYRAGKTVTYIGTPVISSLTNLASKVKISWSPVAGAAKYRVFIKSGGQWTKLGDTAETSFRHTNVTSGKKYAYTVRCISADGKRYTGAYNAAGKSIIYKDPPVVSRFTDTPLGTRITWNACDGAAKYRVFVKNGDVWDLIGETALTTLTHAAENQTEYTYTVRAYDKKGSPITYYYPAGWKHVYQIPSSLDTPVITLTETTPDGVWIRWRPVNGADVYRVLVKEGGKWITAGDTTANHFTHVPSSTGVTYTYTVCCIDSRTGTFLSEYNPVGVDHFYVKIPVIRYVTDTAGGPVLTWDAYDGAACYRVTILDGEEQIALCDTAATVYLHTDAQDDTDYTYAVYPLNEAGEPLFDNPPVYTHHVVIDPDHTVYTTAQFGDAIAAAFQSEPPATEPNVPLTHLLAAHMLTDAIGYAQHTEITLSDTDDIALHTAAYFSYFLPDNKDRIFPDKHVTAEEYEILTTDLARYAALHGKKMLAFGDSIVYGSGNSARGFSHMIAEKYGMSYTSYAIPGATFGMCDNNASHISDQIISAYADNRRTDIIVINGGTNDMNLSQKGLTPDYFDPAQPELSTFALGFDYSLTLLHRYWPSVPILYVRMHNMALCSDTLERSVGEYALSAARDRGANTVDLYTDTDMNTEIKAIRDRYTRFKQSTGKYDGVHPTALGYAMFYLRPVSDGLAQTLIP